MRRDVTVLMADPSVNGRPLGRAGLLHLTTLWILLLGVAVASETSETPVLRPYVATYATTAMGMKMTLTRTLEQREEGYQLSNTGSVFLASLDESSRFTLLDGRIRGDHFRYRLSGLVSRKRIVEFQPAEGKIRSLRKKVWTDHDFETDILDRLSQQEQLRLDIAASPTPPEQLRFRVVDGDRVKEKALALVGEETVTTQAGTFNTLHYRQTSGDTSKRSSDIWLAPDLDYLMVKTVHIEKGSEVEIALLNVAFEPGNNTEGN